MKRSRGGPLEGVRVLELTKVWAGPHAGKLLAFLGAEVIKVESNTNLDELRAFGGVDIDRAPFFLSLHQEILSVQVNIKASAGVDIVKQMVAQSDIVLNNLRPRAMERLGLGYEELRKIKPDIIFVSLKMYGNDGPLGYQTGYAPTFAALGGMNYLVGYEGGPPLGVNMRYGDSPAGAAAAYAATVALLHRERTGEGQFVDVSAVECVSSLVGDRLFEYSITGESPGPEGSRNADMAPHACYPCLNEEWISIAVASEKEWHQLCEVLGDPTLAEDPRMVDLTRRREHLAALDERIATLTRPQSAAELAQRLRKAGVGAFKSLSTLDLVSDEELWKDFYVEVADKVDGTRPILGAPWRMSRSQAKIENGAPRLGEHNDYVYREVLGLSDETIEILIREGVIK